MREHVRTMSARELQEIPNIGPAVARKLERLDITCVADLGSNVQLGEIGEQH